ncbi:hypothetical protein BELL_1075g00010 [Botrytis elliptica]|uniref:BTB domain-containing protein n=1 Tax=Botrytis elliptica TaxID=278938 RepID=A0A4Z1IPI0_9HELO|nr:hypothetical protein EAE99_008337 [Botrytis elliptica]TGO63471.1 hypothetical protein BELL_1075g00010 [Botrytis elliptica]
MAANGLGINLVANHNIGIIPWPHPANEMSQLDAIISDTDDTILAGMSEILEAYIRRSGHRGLSRVNVLRISRILAATYQAPDKPKTTKSALAPLSGGFDIDDQKNFNKIVSINVGTGKQRVQFTAIAGLLAAQAEYFKPLCSDLWKCGRESIISLEDYQPESFEMFLAWLYTKDIRNAKCLGKNTTRSNTHFRTQAHKYKWFQLLRCYFLADYIGASKFANYMMDALTLAYREWVRDGFVKSAKDPLFNKTEETRKLVDSNTVESSPLRALIKNILFPSVEESRVPVTINRRPRAPPSFRRTRRGIHNPLVLNPLFLPHGQNIQFPNDGTAPHPNFQPGHPLFTSNFPPTTLNAHPPPPTIHHMHNAAPSLSTGIAPAPHFHPHPPPTHPHSIPIFHPIPQGGPFHAGNHHLPISHRAPSLHHIPHNPFANHYNIRNQHPFLSPMPLPPRPTLRSRFLKAMKFGRDEEKVDSESVAIEFKEWEKASMVWEHERCRYHIHAMGKDCRDEE